MGENRLPDSSENPVQPAFERPAVRLMMYLTSSLFILIGGAMLLGLISPRHDGGFNAGWLLVGFGAFNILIYFPFLTRLAKRRRDRR